MDPHRYRLPSRYGKSHDLGLLSLFLLTILLLVSVVAVLTAGTAWTLPEVPRIQPLAPRASGLFGASVIDRPPAATQAPTSPAASGEPTRTATAVPPTPTQAPTPSPTPAQVRAYVVGNTDGVGVWLRRTPRMNDYLLAWVDGTRMEVVGPDVQAEGRLWRHVRDPRGNVGYIPAEWLVPAP